MSKNNYLERLGLTTLSGITGVTKKTATVKQLKAIKNIKWATNDEWQFVNSWYDERAQFAQDNFKEPEALFNSIYNNSLTNLYDEGCVAWGKNVEAYLKDIRFCGKAFLEKVVFFYLVKLLEEAVVEVELNEEEQEKVFIKLQELKNKVLTDN